ncbi:ChbG/HpnK family deacetylase [Variovorax sp.]|jgi:predicted glycoside hydrolase/deacetylase ChbG (UPF0249 family)|uniref:ChbG/HpnK family deacetylase n=1 Tax=Variovorax sp. TaxID=1871043 RepID=UPI0037D9FA27
MSPSSREATAEGPRSICICVDDFGMGHAINEAALVLAERERISAVGCMVRRAAWLPGARLLRRLDRRRTDIGLHLDLTRPAVPGGREPGLLGLLVAPRLRPAARLGIQAEIRTQLARFEDAMGRAPAFVDGHRHVHQFAGVRELLVAELARRYPDAPPWLRSTEPGWRHGSDGFKAAVIHGLGGAALAALAREHGIPTSRRLLGVYGFSGDGQAYRARLLAWLAVAARGDVLMCHPSLGRVPGDPHGAARMREYAVLRALALPAAGEPGAIRIAPLSAVLQGG